VSVPTADVLPPAIRLARAADLDIILGIENTAPAAAHWARSEYEKAITQSERLVLVAESKGQVSGFLVASTATEEWELENVVVSPKERRRGIGRALMVALIAHANSGGASEIRQEIRLSNIAAQKLGQTVGFRQEGRRTEYYRDPTEDALLFKYLVT
jgi:ribosomal-protein-alanine N-acetyltransferase